MKNYFNASKRFTMLSVFYVIAGLAMLLWPHLTMELLGKALGVGMLVVGLAYVIIYFTKDHLERIMEMDLTIGVVLAAFGAFLLLHADFVGMALPFGIAVLVLIGGISKIQNAIDMKNLQSKRWQIMLGMAVLLILLGALLVYNPFTEVILIYYMGVCMVIDGVTSIVALLTIAGRMKKMERGKVPFHGPMGPDGAPRDVIEGDIQPPHPDDPMLPPQ